MPLILFSGYPSSGKTTIAKELVKLLQERIDSTPSLEKFSIVCHSDESLGISHSDYITSQDERKLRSKITSAVRRDLSKRKIVIVDSLNYIKGFRYQLHCEAKNVSTTFCLVQTLCPVDIVRQWNRSSQNPWDETLLTELIQRYEEPNPQNTWDKPLFPIYTPTDKLESIIEELHSAVFPTDIGNGPSKQSKSTPKAGVMTGSGANSNVLKPNIVTQPRLAQRPDFVYLLDTETSKVVNKLMEFIKERSAIGASTRGERVMITGSDINDADSYFVDLPLQDVNLAKLQRLKRQFIMLYKLRDLEVDRVIPLFTDYLNKNL